MQFDTYSEAQEYALTQTESEGREFFAVDKGTGISPRYTTCKVPAVGDEVSEAFNGDYYPCGKIVEVSPSLSTIKTDSGVTFTRRNAHGTRYKAASARWLRRGSSCFAMVQGNHDRRNPSF